MASPAAGTEAPPDGLWLAYYGDDFTGSTDAMEALTAAGVPTVLFFQAPTPEARARFAQVRAVGVAGTARSRSPEWMDRELPPVFQALKALGAPVLHYKVCSTFDSSPHTGSIGRAIDLGVACMGGDWSPLVVGAPRLKRYQLFGHLFAVVDGTGHRLDRHPVMSRHPVTPMDESDLRRHLARQTTRRIGLVDLPTLQAGRGSARLDALLALAPDGLANVAQAAPGWVPSTVPADSSSRSPAAAAPSPAPIVSIDVVDEASLAAAGALVWSRRGAGVFSASSSGLSYALAAHWRSLGWLPAQPGLPTAQAVDRIAAVSGSCSPVTAAQIAWARAHGFAVDRLRLPELLVADGRRDGSQAEIERAVAAAQAALAEGRSPLLFSAEGPDDPAVTGFDALASDAGLSHESAARRVGEALGEALRRLLQRVPLQRVVVAGGDSSGEVAQRLGLDALTAIAALSPGAPLCQGWRDGQPVLELVLKGGQIGAPAFFGSVRAGRVIPE